MRRILYKATVSAVQHNPATRAFYTRLCDKGKPRKVALVAATRKLLVMLNAIMRDQVPKRRGKENLSQSRSILDSTRLLDRVLLPILRRLVRE